MWIYVPSTAILGSPSSQELVDSTLLLNSLCLRLSVSVTSRSRLMPAKFWSRVCRKAPWMMRRSGLILEPSMADRGVASWISLLRARLVNPSALPESSVATKTRERGVKATGQSHTCSGSSASVNPPWCSARMFLPGFAEDSSDQLERNYAEWVTRSRSLSSFVRRMLARAIAASGSSSSLPESAWPTPNVPSGGRAVPENASRPSDCTAYREDGRKIQLGLEYAVKFWPTPDANTMNDGESTETFLAKQEALKETADNGNGCGTPLAMAAQMWATPRASENENRTTKHAPSHLEGTHGETLAGQASLWATPASRDWRAGDASQETLEKNSRPLNEQAVSLWSSPRATDGEKGGPNMSFGAGGTPLPTQAASHSLLQGQETETLGEPSSIAGRGLLPPSQRKRLNSYFVTLLQGLPLGWTSVTETINCEHLEIWLCRSREQLHLLCSSIALESH